MQSHTRRWSSEQDRALLDFWLAHVEQYRTGVKKTFFNAAAALPALRSKNAAQVRSKCYDIERRYRQMAKMLTSTRVGGRGSEGNASSLRVAVQSRFPLFDQVHAILGEGATEEAGDEPSCSHLSSPTQTRAQDPPSQTPREAPQPTQQGSVSVQDVRQTQATTSTSQALPLLLPKPTPQPDATSLKPSTSISDAAIRSDTLPSSTHCRTEAHSVDSSDADDEARTPAISLSNLPQRNAETNTHKRKRESFLGGSLSSVLKKLGEEYLELEKLKFLQTMEFQQAKLDAKMLRHGEEMAMRKAEFDAKMLRHGEKMDMRRAELSVLLKKRYQG